MASAEDQLPISKELIDQLLSDDNPGYLVVGEPGDKGPRIASLPDNIAAPMQEFEDLFEEFRTKLQKLYEPTLVEINRFYQFVHTVVDQATAPDDRGEGVPIFWNSDEEREWIQSDIHANVLSAGVRQRFDNFFSLIVEAETLGLIETKHRPLLHNQTD